MNRPAPCGYTGRMSDQETERLPWLTFGRAVAIAVLVPTIFYLLNWHFDTALWHDFTSHLRMTIDSFLSR